MYAGQCVVPDPVKPLWQKSSYTALLLVKECTIFKHPFNYSIHHLKIIIMCFSAQASFVVGGCLIIMGAAIITKVRTQKDWPIALIPLIFAAQQITEGLLWVSLTNEGVQQAQSWLSNIYAVFVGAIWPLYVPFAIYSAETNCKRRKITAFIGLAGLGLAIYTIVSLINQPVTTEIYNNHIYYDHEIHGQALIISMYILSTCVPFLISSFRSLHITGFVITLGFFVAYFVYTKTFASVWCFFAAIASALIFLYFTHRAQKPLIRIP